VQLADEVVGGWKLDVRVKVADEAKLDPPLVQITLEVEQKRFHSQLRAAERRAIADRKGRDEVSIRRARPACISAEGGYQLVGLDRDVGRREAQPPADPLPRLHRPRHRVFAPEQPVRMLDLAGRYEAAHLRAVKIVAVDRERRDDLNMMSVVAEPGRAAGAPSPEREVVADYPAPQLHHGRQPVDELLRRQGGELAVEAQHDRVLDARPLEQRKLFLQGGDRLRAVGRVQDAPRVWLESG